MKHANLKLKALSAIVVACTMAVAGAASAQTVQGGGATLPQPLYEELFGITAGKASQVLGTWSYAGTGSGTGKSAFLNDTATSFSKTGHVHFAGSDSALTATEVDNYNTAHNKGSSSTGDNFGRLIQIPSVLTAVTLPYMAPSGSGITELNLTRKQVCEVFSGQTTTWGTLLGTADTTPITVVYRSEGSGTSELLSNFLSAACGSYLPTDQSFTVSNSFATVVSNAGGIRSNWVAATGSGGVATAMETAGSIAYLSPDYKFKPDDATLVAKIDGALPTAISFPTDTKPPATTVTRNNPLNWVPSYVLPTDSAVYPIYGTTNMLFNQCYADGTGNGTVGAAVKDFLTKLSSGAFDTTITGNYFVPLPTEWSSAISSVFLNSKGSLGIGNTSVCNGIGRPS
ncbi:substrate-binding domain-containing protein [Comamonas sp. GB3 AK4-5]|uniref:substrate-binding domain-containing protein n=1 Tax=Comamonas sp. GB3 AK4-5 TaxID=3231487 RepID=UPI00351F274E